MKTLIRVLNMMIYTSTGRFIIQLIALFIVSIVALLFING